MTLSDNTNGVLTVGISHRLGNQLFQYATGRAAAQRTGQDLQLDLRFLHQHPEMEYSLPHYRIDTVETGTLPPVRSDGLRYRLWKLRSVFTGQRIIERRNDFTPAALTPPKNAQLRGYWQNARYFADQADVIRRDLTLCEALKGENARTAQRIAQSGTPVSLHVRRNDYLDHSDTFVVLTPRFFQEAAQRLKQQVAGPLSFYLFSDDPEWAEANLDLPGEKFLVHHHSGTTPHTDLHLMSLCRHHIIANSTFSWWGAWLNPSPEKIVIAPAKWYRGSWLSSDFIVPQDWIAHPVHDG